MEILIKGLLMNEKITDWWAKHKVGSRVALIVFLLLLIAVVVRSLFIPSDAEKLKHLLDAVIELNLWAFIAVAFGINGVERLAQVWEKVRGK